MQQDVCVEGPERTAAMSVRPWKEGGQARGASRVYIRPTALSPAEHCEEKARGRHCTSPSGAEARCLPCVGHGRRQGRPPGEGRRPLTARQGTSADRPRGSWTACRHVQRLVRPPLWISWPASSGHRGCRRCFMTPASPDSGAWCCCDAGSAAPGHAGRAHAGPVEPDMPARPPSCRPAPSV